MTEPSSDVTTTETARRWHQRLGPGLITACVVIGPGSIMTSSQVGATYGYEKVWVVLIAALLMMTYMTLGAKLGVVSGRSTGDMLTEQVGRWSAALIGVSIFFIASAFQFGNNLGVRAALVEYEPILKRVPGLTPDLAVVALNLLTILFLFAFQNLYRFVERLMAVLVAMMLISFAVNLIFARPDVAEFLRGLIPPRETFQPSKWSSEDLSVLGLIGTTFVIAAAYYQAYLVRQKGWERRDLRDGLVDVRLGVVIMASITLMLMSTAAAQLRGQALATPADIAAGLRPAFGKHGDIFFCVGLFAAAYSSFLINSMVGGFVLADGLGLGSKSSDRWPRRLTVGVILIGMIVALRVSRTGVRPVTAIVAAQAVTVVAGPMIAAAIWALTNQRRVMGHERNGWILNTLAALGFIVLLVLAYHTAAFKVWPTLQQLVQGQT